MSPQLQDALGMFAFLAIELSVLFIGISLLVGVLQRHIPPIQGGSVTDFQWEARLFSCCWFRSYNALL